VVVDTELAVLNSQTAWKVEVVHRGGAMWEAHSIWQKREQALFSARCYADTGDYERVRVVQVNAVVVWESAGTVPADQRKEG